MVRLHKPRVLHVINSLAYGGAEVALAHLANYLQKAGFEVWIGTLFSLGPIADRILLPRERLVCFGFQLRGYHLDVAAYFRLFRFIRLNRIQVVHTHLPQSNTLGRLVAWLARVPVIAATEHNTYMNKSRRAIWADRMLARATTQMLAVSGAVRSFASRQASLSQDRYLVVPNGVPVKEIQLLTPAQKERKRAEIGLPLEKPVAISVGRLTEQKGIQHLLRAAKIHLREFPDTVFLVVGDGPLRTDLHALAASLELLPSLRFLGARDDVWELLQVSDLLVMPSLWEGLPVAMIEAAACGIPVVASRVGGVEEVVEDGVSGLLVPPGDDAALASSIAYMLSVPERRLQMGGEARRRVEERFSVDRVGKAIADLYCHLWGRTQTASRKRSD